MSFCLPVCQHKIGVSAQQYRWRLRTIGFLNYIFFLDVIYHNFNLLSCIYGMTRFTLLKRPKSMLSCAGVPDNLGLSLWKEIRSARDLFYRHSWRRNIGDSHRYFLLSEWAFLQLTSTCLGTNTLSHFVCCLSFSSSASAAEVSLSCHRFLLDGASSTGEWLMVGCSSLLTKPQR